MVILMYILFNKGLFRLRRAPYKKIMLDGNLKTTAQSLGLGKRWVIQHDTNPKNTTKSTITWIQKKSDRASMTVDVPLFERQRESMATNESQNH